MTLNLLTTDSNPCKDHSQLNGKTSRHITLLHYVTVTLLQGALQAHNKLN